MRAWRRPRGAGLLVAAALLATACVTPSPPAPRVELTGGPAPTRFGATGAQVLGHPSVAPQLPALFGPDWAGAPGAPLAPTRPARDFFGRVTAPRGLRVADREYVAVLGCVPGACRSQRGVLLVAADGGSELRARLEEGVRHDYAFGPAFGPGARMDEAERRALDAAWRALERDAAAWPRDP